MTQNIDYSPLALPYSLAVAEEHTVLEDVYTRADEEEDDEEDGVSLEELRNEFAPDEGNCCNHVHHQHDVIHCNGNQDQALNLLLNS